MLEARLLIFLLFLVVLPTRAMEFTIKPLNLGSSTQVEALHLDGVVQEGDGQKFQQFLDGLNPSVEQATIWIALNSEGGSVREKAGDAEGAGLEEPLRVRRAVAEYELVSEALPEGVALRSADRLNAALPRLHGIATQQTREELFESLNERNSALAKATEAAENAAQTKSDFLANMSHEIRTPMNAIMGLTHLALRGELADKQRDYLQKIHQSAQHLLGIINDILDFSKIEARKLTVEAVEFELEKVLQKIKVPKTDFLLYAPNNACNMYDYLPSLCILIFAPSIFSKV
jgi:signal transduction histidine kinase